LKDNFNILPEEQIISKIMLFFGIQNKISEENIKVLTDWLSNSCKIETENFEKYIEILHEFTIRGHSQKITKFAQNLHKQLSNEKISEIFDPYHIGLLIENFARYEYIFPHKFEK